MAFAHKRAITIDHTKVGATDSVNFPVLVSGIYSYLATIANGGSVNNASGFDIGFYSDSALTTKLSWETELYTASTGQVIYWVKVPTVSHTVDTVIYLAYGDATISTDQSNKTGVWDANFLGVWHLSQASGTVLDSTSNARNGTSVNSPTYGSTGKIGTAMTFAAASSQGVSFGNYVATSALTYSAWFKANTLPAGLLTVFEKASGNTAYVDILVYNNAGVVHMYWVIQDQNTGAYTVNPGTATISTGNWYYAVLTYNTTVGMNEYINGASDGANVPFDGWAPMNSTVPMQIGYDPSFGRYFDGLIDEVRVSNIARSADWILAEYNNQNSPSTFYTVGNDLMTDSTLTVLGVG